MAWFLGTVFLDIPSMLLSFPYCKHSLVVRGVTRVNFLIELFLSF